MKKIIIAIIIAFVGVVSMNAQIAMTGGGSLKNSSYISKDMYGHVTSVNGQYCIVVKDCQSNGVLYVNLGDTSDKASQSLKSILETFGTMKNKEYITFNDGSTDITLYKYSNHIYFTDGDAEYAKEYLKGSMMRAMVGTPMKRARENDSKIGWIKTSTLENALEKISTM